MVIMCLQLPKILTTIFLFLLHSFTSHAWATDSNPQANSIGVNYGQVANNLPPVEQVVRLVRSTTIGKIKLYDANPTILRAFANTSILFTVGIANDRIPSLTTPTSARSWIDQNITPFLPATQITTICVGNEILTSGDQTLLSQLLPAMESLQAAVASANLQTQVKITTPHSLALLSTSFPPSAGAFDATLLAVVKPLLGFLSRTNSSFMVNAYPYFAYRRDPRNISLAYALFLPNTGVYDPATGILYSNLFSAQIDAVYSAMARVNVTDVEVGVSETGWPSVGAADEVGVNVQNAMTYIQNLIYYVVSNPGTPLRPHRRINTFVFALFNENLKAGPISERNFGLYQADGSAVYDVRELATSPSTSVTTNSSADGGAAAGAAAGAENKLWCVVKPGSDRSLLAATIGFACGQGAADCSAIQPGGSCYYPDDLVSHASYAFNSYYQRHGRNYWNCNFESSAIVTITNPSYGGCTYPAN